MSYDKHYFLAPVGLSHSLDVPDHVFSLFSTSERQLALAETPKTRDLAIFVVTTTTTQPITLPRGKNPRNKSLLVHFR